MIDLSGVHFSAGIDFDFADNTILLAGDRILVVRKETAFAIRYPGVPAGDIAGEFQNGTALANNGEPLSLLAVDDSTTKSLSYDDKAPWPEEPDQTGVSLALMQAATNPDHSVAAERRPRRQSRW